MSIIMRKIFTLILVSAIFVISAFIVSAQTQVFNGALTVENSISSHEVCSENGTDYVQTFQAIEVSETATYTLRSLNFGSSINGTWSYAMLSTSPEFITGDYIMYASSYGELDTLTLDAGMPYYLYVSGCSYLEQQTYPMTFAYELRGAGEIIFGGE